MSNARDARVELLTAVYRAPLVYEKLKAPRPMSDQLGSSFQYRNIGLAGRPVLH